MSANGTGIIVEADKVEHRDVRGRFTKGWKGGGRPQGSLDKALAIRELVFAHALGKTEDGKIRAVDALERVREQDPTAYLKLISSTMPKSLAPRAATGNLTLAALIQVLDQQPARLVDARVIETPAIAAPDEELLGDDGDDDDDESEN